VKWHRLSRHFKGRHWRSVSRRLNLPTVTRDFAGETRLIRNLLDRTEEARLVIDFISGAPLLPYIKQGVVLSGHDCMSRLFREEAKCAENWRKGVHFRIRELFSRNAERQFAHLADRVHLITQTDADEMSRINPGVKPAVIPISAETPPAHKLKLFSERKERVLWGNLGSPTILSGVRGLFTESKRKSSQVMRGFVLLGKVSEAEAHQLLPELVTLGIRYQSKVDDLGVFLGNTRIVLLADVSGTGQKNRTLDALAHGCCVAGLAEVFRDIPNDRAAPAFVDTTNMAELVSELEKLDSAEMAAIARRGQVMFQENFSFPVLKSRWSKLLESLPALRLA